MSEENKARMRRLLEEFINRGNEGVVDETTAPTWRMHVAGNSEPMDREGVKQFIRMFRAAFPDLRDTVEDMIAEGDKVAVRGVTRGTHQGEFMGIPATGRQVRASWIDLVRFTPDGKVAENFLNFDMLGLMQQIGAIPAPGHAPTPAEATD